MRGNERKYGRLKGVFTPTSKIHVSPVVLFINLDRLAVRVADVGCRDVRLLYNIKELNGTQSASNVSFQKS